VDTQQKLLVLHLEKKHKAVKIRFSTYTLTFINFAHIFLVRLRSVLSLLSTNALQAGASLYQATPFWWATVRIDGDIEFASSSSNSSSRSSKSDSEGNSSSSESNKVALIHVPVGWPLGVLATGFFLNNSGVGTGLGVDCFKYSTSSQESSVPLSSPSESAMELEYFEEQVNLCYKMGTLLFCPPQPHI
jgi:hypothetical protein